MPTITKCSITKYCYQVLSNRVLLYFIKSKELETTDLAKGFVSHLIVSFSLMKIIINYLSPFHSEAPS